jgi:hypothetical protein
MESVAIKGAPKKQHGRKVQRPPIKTLKNLELKLDGEERGAMVTKRDGTDPNELPAAAARKKRRKRLRSRRGRVSAQWAKEYSPPLSSAFESCREEG